MAMRKVPPKNAETMTLNVGSDVEEDALTPEYCKIVLGMARDDVRDEVLKWLKGLVKHEEKEVTCHLVVKDNSKIRSGSGVNRS